MKNLGFNELLSSAERGFGTTMPILAARRVRVEAQTRLIIRRADLTLNEGEVFGIVGPSGVGKTIFLRCLNRLNDLIPEIRVRGEITYNQQSIHGREVDVHKLRSRIGMVLQQPVIFPVSIAENVLFGVRRIRRFSRAEAARMVEHSLRNTTLWDEVKDRLKWPATTLSVGQQQRLCLARTLAVDPEILLMDEPTSALDPRSTEAIEQLILRLRKRHTIVLVTHNLAQARRVTDHLGCLVLRQGAGEMVETRPTEELLEDAHASDVRAYLQGAP